MTDRITKVILRGDIGDLLGKLRATTSAVKSTASAMTDASKEAKVWRQDLTAVGTSAGKLGLVAAAGVAVAVRSFAKFDQAMSNVAATGDDARNNIEALRDAALDAGARTQYSAAEAAAAVENLAKAGLTAADILNGGLNGALDLAAAGGLEVADAAQYAAISMKQFGLEGSSIPHIADLLAAGAGKAVGDVSDLGAALSQAGQVASQTGLTIEETTGGLSAFASAGLLGSDSGTSFKSMLQRLTPQSAQAQKAMDSLGISAYDASGNFVGLASFAGNLQTALADLTPQQRNSALATIFGSDAVRAASVLYSEGEEGIRGWIEAVDDQGYAAEVAAVRMDNLSGDLEQLKGALETALIGTGAGANGPLRDLVQLLTGLVDVYNDLPGPIKTAMLAGAALTAGIGGTVFMASRAIAAYSNLKTNLNGLGASFDAANKKALLTRAGFAAAGVGLAALSAPAHKANEQLGDLTDVASAAALGFAAGGPWGAAIGGGIALISSLGDSGKSASLDMGGLTATLDKQTGALTKNSAEWAAKALQDMGTADWADLVGVSLDTLTDAALGNADAMKEIQDKTKDLPGWLQDQVGGAVEDLSGSISAASKNQKDAASTADELAGGIEGVGAEAGDAASEVDSLTGALDKLLDPLLDQDEASVAWKRSIQSLTEELKKAGGGLDDMTKKGQDNRDAIRDRVKALKESAEADLEAGGSQEAFTRKLERGAAQILEAGTAAGISKKQMRGYLTTLGLTPEQIKTAIKADTKQAVGALNDVQNALRGIRSKTVYVNVEKGIHVNPGSVDGGTQLKNARGSITDYYADGGFGETHVAQIAPAGITRIWNEPETGGEAYIPFAMSKRKRSQEIAMQTVSRLGGVAAFANGGLTGSAGSPGPVTAVLRDNRLRVTDDGLVKLVDTRVDLVYAANSSHDRGPRR